MENLFILFVFPIFVFVFGLVGNSLGLLVLMKRKRNLYKIGPIKIYIYLFLIDTFYLFQILASISANGGHDISIINSLTCKVANYFNYSFATISPMLLVYLSFDRFIVIKYPHKSIYMRKRINQLKFLIVVIFFNLFYYSPVLYYYDLNRVNRTSNETLFCGFANPRGQLIISLMDLLNRVLVPSALMFLSSNLIVCLIYKLRTRIIANFKPTEVNNFNRDIRLAVSSILMNLIFIVFNLPISITLFLPFEANSFLITFYLYYLSYAVNFYIILHTNQVYRHEALVLFKLKHTTRINHDLEMDITHMQQIKF